MQDLAPNESPREAQTIPEKRTGRTGPTTPEGKAKSSQNSTKHGLRSEKTVLPEEDPEEFAATIQDWFNQYSPATPEAITLVEQTARAQWFLMRAEKKVEEIEWNLPENAFDWNDAHHQSFEKFLRYKTTRERSFLRFHKELQAHYDRLRRDSEAKLKARLKLAAVELKWLAEKGKEMGEELRITQYIEVETIDGKARTRFSPTAGQLIEKIAERGSPPIFVWRWIHFLNGVPSEYAWADPAGLRNATPSAGVQRMLYREWVELAEREKATGHACPVREDLLNTC